MVAENSPCKQFTVMSDTEILSPEGQRRRQNARRPLSSITNNAPGAGLSPGKLAFPIKQEMAKPLPPATAPKQESALPPKKESSGKASSSAGVVLGVLAAVAVIAAAAYFATTSPPSPSLAPAAQVPVQATNGADAAVEEWAELSPGEEDLFDEGEGGLSHDAVPWAAALISGPMTLDSALLEGLDEAGEGGIVGVFARLTQHGELFLFSDADTAAPLGMLAVDGCATQHNLAPREPARGCFSMYPASGGYGVACVGDMDEAFDWSDAMKMTPCE